MKKNVLLQISDEKYLDHARSTFGSFWRNGKWKDDCILFVEDSVSPGKIVDFIQRGISIRYVKNSRPDICPLWIKTNIFDKILTKWDNILFVDSDIICFNEILDFSKIITNRNTMYGTAFDTVDRLYNCDVEWYRSKFGRSECLNTGVLLFTKEFIENNDFSKERLEKEQIKYNEKLLIHDETLISILWNEWIPFPKNFHVPANRLIPCKEDTILCHFYSEKSKPWTKWNLEGLDKTQKSWKSFLNEVYKTNLEYYWNNL